MNEEPLLRITPPLPRIRIMEITRRMMELVLTVATSVHAELALITPMVSPLRMAVAIARTRVRMAYLFIL